MNDLTTLQENLKQKLWHLRMDGVSNVVRSEYTIIKVFWSLLFVIIACLCVYLIAESIVEYCKFQVTTNFRKERELKATFPTIFLCNANPLNTEYYVQLLDEANMTELDTDPYYNFVALEYYKLQSSGRYFTDDEIRRLNDVDGFLISCTFKKKPCSSASLKYIFLPYFLHCIQFNVGFDSNEQEVNFETVKSSGDLSELSMEFYVGIPDSLTSRITKRGVWITITNGTEDPSKNSPSPIELTPGLGMRINVVRNVYNQFNKWPFLYSDCMVSEDNKLLEPLEDETFFNRVLSTNFSYSQDSCMLICYQYYSALLCNCTTIWINYQEKGYEYCFNEQQTCADDFYYQTFNIGDFIVNNCINKCPYECNTHRYDNYQSFYKYPEPLYLENTLSKNQMLIDRYSNQTDFTVNLASNVAKVSIYYDELSYTEVKEAPRMTWDELLGKLGGHLHLFLGMSALGFVELFEVLITLSILLKITHQSLLHLRFENLRRQNQVYVF